MQPIAIAGVSGHTGRAAPEKLLLANQPVRVIVRDVAKGAAWRERGAEVAVADPGDERATRQALAGVPGGDPLPQPVRAAQNRAPDFLGGEAAPGGDARARDPLRRRAPRRVPLLDWDAASVGHG